MSALLVFTEFIKEENENEQVERVLTLLRHYYQKYKNECNENEIYKEPTEAEIKNRILPEDVKKKFCELKKELIKRDKDKAPFDYLKWKRYLILSFYHFLPPLRGQEYYSVKICNWKKTKIPDVGNYIDVENWRLVNRSHKTSRSYGEHIIDIQNNELRNIIKLYIKKSELQDGDYLLVKDLKGKEPLNTRYFTDTLKCVVGKSVNELRQMYISNFLDELEKKKHNKEIKQSVFNKKRKELAALMGHSIATQERRYTKYRGLE